MSSSKTKNLVGGKTLSLWIPDEDWVDDFNHLLAKRSKQDRSITRNSLLLECVQKGLSNLGEQVDQSDSLRIYLDTFPPEQAELLRTPAGKQLVVNLLSAILSGQLNQLGQLTQTNSTITQTDEDGQLNQSDNLSQNGDFSQSGHFSQSGTNAQPGQDTTSTQGGELHQGFHVNDHGPVSRGAMGTHGGQAIPSPQANQRSQGNQVSQGNHVSPSNQAEQRVPYHPEPVRPRPQPQLERRPSPSASAYVAAAKEPTPEEPPKQERKIPDLFHTLMRNTKINS